MSEDRKSATGKAWWEWLGFGGVAQTLAKGAILFLLILLIIGTVMCCIVPCVRSIIGKLVSETLVSYTLLMQDVECLEKTDLYEGVRQEAL